jgi:potassium-dependent mechanosensitive channel
MTLNIKGIRSRSVAALLLWGFLLALAASPWAASPPVAATRESGPVDENAQLAVRRLAVQKAQESVVRERAEVEALVRENELRLKTLSNEGVSRALLDQAELAVDSLKVRVQSIEVEQQGSRREIENLETIINGLEDQIKGLKNAPQGSADPQARTQQISRLQADLELKQASLQLEKQNLSNLQNAQQVAKEHQAVATKWFQNLQQLFLAQQEIHQAEALEDLQARIQKEQQALRKQAADLRQRLEQSKGDDPKSKGESNLLETQIQDAEERARLKEADLLLVQAKNKLDTLSAVTTTGETQPAALKEAYEQAEVLLRDLQANHNLMRQKAAVLEQQKQVVEKRSLLAPEARKQGAQEIQLIDRLLQELQKKADALGALLDAAGKQRDALKSRYEQSVEHSLKVRRTLPIDMIAWEQAGLELLLLPKVMSQQAPEALKQIRATLQQTGIGRLPLIVLLELVWIGIILWLRRHLHHAIQRFSTREPSFSIKLVLMALQLVFWNITPAGLAGLAVLFLALVDLPQPASAIVIALAATGVSCKFAVNLSWLLLAAPSLPPERQQPVIYRKLRGALGAAALFTAIVLMVHFLPTSMTLKDLFNRLYMVFLLLVTLALLHSRRLFITLFATIFSERPVWLRMAQWISGLLPAAILLGAVLGLLGYVNLAWTISTYVGWFLVVLVGWLVLCALLQDLVTVVKDHVQTHSIKGLAWTQGVIDPLFRVVRVVLFLSAWVVLFQLYGWDEQSPAVRAISGVLHSPLFTMGSHPFDTVDLVFTGIVVWLVVLAARWSREVTYRWVYSGVGDPGARHSLSVFTQYAVVLIGALITLRVLGIDLTTFAIFAGALGVGVGLGLQSIANNFISGILLLIERPLRTGDYVTIGNNEGEVTRIGIRSLTVRTQDNQEIIIPNADVISHQFTNWTHTDSIVRIRLEVGISYDNDPHQAQKLIARVLEDDPMVLGAPPPRVWLKEYADSAVNFRIHYFIDVRKHLSWASKSAVLFAIWDRFKAAGIQIPYPQREIYIRQGPPALALNNSHVEGEEREG